MKFKYIIPFIALAGMSLLSCDDTKMEWYKDPSHGDVSTSELPLELAEKISRYAPLKNYATEFIIGAGVGADLYLNDETYRNIVDQNFVEITTGNAMKHRWMVKSDGTLDFTNIDNLISHLQTAGLGLYGHTLTWHQNQNAGYLNGLIAPQVIPGGDGDNLLTNGDFEDGTTGWGSWGGAKGSVAATSDVKLAGTSSLKIVTKDNAANLWDLQVQAPAVPLVVGHHYEISFWVKSEGAGGVRLSFGDANQMSGSQYPWHSTEGEFAVTSSEWKQVVYSGSTIYSADNDEFVAVGTSMQFRLDFGKFPNITYYIDNVTVKDLDAEPAVVNLISNSNFESGNISPWTGWGNSSTREISADGEGFGDTGYAMKLTNPTSASNYNAQAKIDFAKLTSGQKYKVSLWIKSSVSDGSVQMQLQPNGGGQYSGDRAVGVAWTQLEWEFTADDDDTSFFIDFGLKAATYYVDNVVLQAVTEEGGSSGGGSGPIIIEKTDEEKAQIIGDALESWISQMVGHCKGMVKAWDVVNEPMDDGKPSSLKTGEGKELASDEFYWQDYLGKDYAVTAFKLARQYGNPDDKLFINDYNLEYNLAKCDGIIEYVKYIESKGAVVDGIGTQMHISIDTNKDNIAQMFQKLGATGKLIKVTELDIKLNTSSPTTEQLAQQAEMYQYVIDMFKKHVPAAQRYAITLWGISDNAKEHEYWIPDDGPNVWDANYNRKHAYKGVADGLAGRDVSEDFTGELQ